MLGKTRQGFEIRPINSLELYQFCDILMDALPRFEKMGARLWSPQEITPHGLLAKYRLDQMYLAHLDGIPVGAMILNQQTRTLELSAEQQQETLFMHKLTVRHDAVGKGIAKRMVDWARHYALAQKVSQLSLVCTYHDDAVKRMLAKFGFEQVEVLNHKGISQRYFRLDLNACTVPICEHIQHYWQVKLQTKDASEALLN